MAKVIERGNTTALKKAHYRCMCESLVVFDKSDIQPDSRDGSYVVCPVCSRWISISVLSWSSEG